MSLDTGAEVLFWASAKTLGMCPPKYMFTLNN